MLASTWTLIKSTVNGYIEDNALSRGAAIAYYTVFSLAPTLVIIVAITALVFGETAAEGALSHQIEGLVGREAAVAIQGMVRSAWQTKSGGIATVIGVVTLLITATAVFGEMQAALNAIWRAEPKGTTVGRLPPKARAASLGLVATLGFLMMVSLVISAGVAAVQTYIGGFLPEVAVLVRILNFVISFGLIAVLFAAIYKILPDRQLQWRDVAIGAIVTALLFDIGKTVIGLYIGSTAVASSFGAAGALADRAALGVLLVADLPVGRRVHPRLRRTVWQPAAAGRAGLTSGAAVAATLRLSRTRDGSRGRPRCLPPTTTT